VAWCPGSSWNCSTAVRRPPVGCSAAFTNCACSPCCGERLRCKEIWVEGADKWRNPDADLPADFETRRLEHYRALAKPLGPAEFIEPLLA
jgi:hypothetical protein